MNYTDSTLLIVGGAPQYFFDSLVIAQTQDVTRTVHSPVKEAAPLIKKDRPWEHVLYFTVNGWSVARNEETGDFNCWYMNWHLDPEEVKRQQVLYCCYADICHARSKDGLTWEKSELDHRAIDGAATNITLSDPDVFRTLESTHVFEDRVDPDPNRRFKIFLDRLVRDVAISDEAHKKTRDGRDGLTDRVAVQVFSSPDGTTWTQFDEEPRFGRHGNRLGDCYTVFSDPESGLYRLLTRAAGMESVHYDPRRPRTGSFFPPHFPNDLARENKRRVFLTESADLVHWSRPQCILTAADLGMNLDDSLYGMIHFKQGEMYVGLVNVLHEVANTMETRLVYSRDGTRWTAADPGQAWLSPTPGAWDRSMVNVSTPPVTVDDETFVFHGGAKNHHDWWIMGLKEGLSIPEAQDLDEVSYGLGLAKMRKDGYISLDAGPVREGVVVTQALRTDGRQLVINAACGEGGYLQVEVTDADEEIIEGCSRENCDTFTGDSTAHTVTWKGKPGIAHNDELRLRIFFKNASLYSLQFE